MSDAKTYPLSERAKADPEKFWSELARKELHWFKPFSKGLEWNPPTAKWFSDGSLNACFNCVDRHATGERKSKPALIWEGEPGDSRVISRNLHADGPGAADSGAGLRAAWNHS